MQRHHRRGRVAGQGRRTALRGLACALAAAGAQPVPAAEVLRYGGDADFPPFESLDAQGRPQGFQVDLLAELGREIGAQFTITLQPWPATEAALRDGSIDVLAMVDTSARRSTALFTRSHATPVITAYLRRGRPEPQDVQGLVGLRLAVPGHEPMRDTLATWLAQLPGPYLQVADAPAALAAVQDGRADAALLPRAYGDRALAAGQAPDVVAAHMNLNLQAYALAVAPGREALRDRLQRGLDALERDGRLQALRVRWLGSHRDLAEQAALRGGLQRQQAWTFGVGGAALLGLGALSVAAWRRGLRVQAEQVRRRHAEAALQEAEERLARTWTHHPEPLLLVERGSGRVHDANPALLALLGVPAEALIGQPVRAQSRHVDAEALEQLVQSLDTAGALDAVPLRLQPALGPARDCLVSASPLTIGGADHVFCIVRDITDQLARDAALRRAYDALAAELAQARAALAKAHDERARAEARLQDYTRAVSHDLKAPLRGVLGLSGLLRERLAAGHLQEALEYSQHIDRAARRMETMIGALTRLARVDAAPLQRTRVSMTLLARETASLLAAAQPARAIQLRVDELPPAECDAGLVAQVWQNLVDNAIKYTARADPARISVDSHEEAGRTWYRVTDNGAGFDMARAATLFQPFQRMHGAREFEGTGVGLSLVRRIVEHHGGEVRLRSAPGVGTVAEFTLVPQPQANPPGGPT